MVNQQGSKDKPEQTFNKNRNDALQMPLNFYIKEKGQINSFRELRYTLHSNPKEGHSKGENIKMFFQRLTYVGCFNLSHILVQLDTTLYFLNVIPFLKSFIK